MKLPEKHLKQLARNSWNSSWRKPNYWTNSHQLCRANVWTYSKRNFQRLGWNDSWRNCRRILNEPVPKDISGGNPVTNYQWQYSRNYQTNLTRKFSINSTDNSFKNLRKKSTSRDCTKSFLNSLNFPVMPPGITPWNLLWSIRCFSLNFLNDL